MNRSLSFAVVAAALILAGPAGATTVEAYDLDDLAVRAARIVTGTVVDIDSRWEGTLIVSDVYVAVDECVKGACEEEVVVTVVGGRADGLAMHVDGMARFEVGEEVLLFLEPAGRAAPGRFRTSGLAQGKFRIVDGGPSAVALRDLTDLALVGRWAARARALSATDLPALKARIEAVLSR